MTCANQSGDDRYGKLEDVSGATLDALNEHINQLRKQGIEPKAIAKSGGPVGTCHIPDDHKAFDGTARGWI